MDLFAALAGRRSVRGFLPDRVPPPTLLRIFETARRAPSWCNIQPWRVWVTSGQATARLTASLTAAVEAGQVGPTDFPFPDGYPEPYRGHRKRYGVALYEAMGIAREDGEARHQAWMRNFVAFEAPHVAMVGIDRRFGVYAALDVGCWLQSVLLAAHGLGVATCPQASLATCPAAVRDVLPVPDEVGLLFGIALGYGDDAAPANACSTGRAPLVDNVTLVD